MDSIKEELHYAKVPIQGKYFKIFGFFVGFDTNFLVISDKNLFLLVRKLHWLLIFLKLNFPNRIFEKSKMFSVGGFQRKSTVLPIIIFIVSLKVRPDQTVL